MVSSTVANLMNFELVLRVTRSEARSGQVALRVRSDMSGRDAVALEGETSSMIMLVLLRRTKIGFGELLNGLNPPSLKPLGRRGIGVDDAVGDVKADVGVAVGVPGALSRSADTALVMDSAKYSSTWSCRPHCSSRALRSLSKAKDDTELR